MNWTFENYQRGGVVDQWGTAGGAIENLSQTIAIATGIPHVRQQLTPGSYAHADMPGRATDIQPGGGRGNPEAMAALEKTLQELDWNYYGIRYVAVNRREYGGSWGGVERVRPQAEEYRGSDGWHERHAHIDVVPGAPVRAIGDIRWAKKFKPVPEKPAKPSQRVLDIVEAIGYDTIKEAQLDLGLAVLDGIAGPKTQSALEEAMGKLDDMASDLEKTKTATGEVLNLLRAYLVGVPKQGVTDDLLADVGKQGTNERAALAEIHHQVRAQDKDRKTVFSRVTQTNEAVSRIDPGKVNS